MLLARTPVSWAGAHLPAQLFGHRNVAVLDGGLPHWLDRNFPIESGAPPAEMKPKPSQYEVREAHFEWIRSREQMRANLETHAELVLDARSRERFYARVPEPRPDTPCGHIPGAINVPFQSMLRGNGRFFKWPMQLREHFRRCRVPLDGSVPLIVHCGSGATACIVALGAYRAGAAQIPSLYDVRTLPGRPRERCRRAPWP